MNERQIPTRNVQTPSDDGWNNPPSAANDLVDEKKAYSDAAEERLTNFVESQIEKMRAYTRLGSNGTPTFFEVNDALMSYHNTHLALLALHNTAKIEYIRAKEAFDDWYAERYIEIRDDVNPRSLSAQKWYSQKEIEMMVRTKFPEKYKELHWNVTLTDQQLNFLRRLTEGWASHQYILTQLSKNLIAEVNGLGVEGALNNSGM